MRAGGAYPPYRGRIFHLRGSESPDNMTFTMARGLGRTLKIVGNEA